MINTRKIINASPIVSSNIFRDMLSPLSKRTGFSRGQSPIIPIFFYRYLGLPADENEYYKNLYKLDDDLSKLENLYLKFTKNIPITRNDSIINKTQHVWQNNTSFSYSNRNKLISDLARSNSLPKLNNSLINSSIEDSLSFILNLYLTTEQNVSLTKLKNFSLKLLTWIDSFVPNIFKDIDYRSLDNRVINPKVFFYGNIKKHEVYFLIFLSRLGCDILYVNPGFDDEFERVDKSQKLSKLLKFPKTGAIKSFISKGPSKAKKTPDSLRQTKTENTSRSFKNLELLNSQNTFTVSHKNSNDLFKDILEPLSKRSGFIGLPMPLIPTYFYRYVGIKESEDKYYNELFKLDKKLQNLNHLYIKFIGNIPLVSNTSLINKTQGIWKEISDFDISKKNLFLSLLIKADAFPRFNDNILDSTFVKSFILIIDMFLKNERNINLSKVKNFSLKILTWSHKFVPKFFKSFDYQKKSDMDIYNPKILYYGEIKKHEILFLILLSHLGCDIIYINSFSDEAFSKFEGSNVYSKLIEFPNKKMLKEFPKEEALLREETTAFRASREIGTIIHNEYDGVYKPWQFENYNTRPKTLKTTFDELKILWNETARMRSGFKVENGTVYIPNLFAKVSGVHMDINSYWNEVKEFKSNENTLFISKIPFTKVTFKASDSYTSGYLLNKDGLIDKKALLQNSIYSFAYLKTALQETIIEKINHLLKVSMFKRSLDKDFRLKILITILSIDKEILRLIQKFDYPSNVPKLVVFDNDESLFNDEDSIILSFLNLMGFDILILTPTGYNNIEDKINEKYFDIFKLEKVKFDLELPNFNSISRHKKDNSGSFWSGLFGSR